MIWTLFPDSTSGWSYKIISSSRCFGTLLPCGGAEFWNRFVSSIIERSNYELELDFYSFETRENEKNIEIFTFSYWIKINSGRNVFCYLTLLFHNWLKLQDVWSVVSQRYLSLDMNWDKFGKLVEYLDPWVALYCSLLIICWHMYVYLRTSDHKSIILTRIDLNHWWRVNALKLRPEWSDWAQLLNSLTESVLVIRCISVETLNICAKFLIV